MPVTFLNPLFLFGLIAGLVPLLLELLFRHRLPVVRFSSIRFLAEIQHRHRRQSSLKNILIMLLRMAALFALAIGFARPTVPGPGGLPVVPAGRKHRAAIVIDNTASMGYREGGVSLLDRAKSLAGRIVDGIESDREVAVYPVSSGKTAVPAWITDREPVKDDIESMALSARGDGLGATLEQIITGLQHEEYALDLFIVSDMQRNTWREVLSGEVRDKLKAAETGGGSPNVNCFICPVGEADSYNLAITRAGFRGQLPLPRSSITVEAEILNGGTAGDTASGLLSLYLNDDKIAETRVEIPAGEKKSYPLEIYLPRPGLYRCLLELTGDALPMDDRYRFVIRVPGTIRAGILGSGEGAAILQAALSPGNGKLTGIETIRPAGISSRVLKRVDTLILINPPLLPRSALEEIRRFVQDGGGLLIIPGPGTVDRFFNEQLFPGLIAAEFSGIFRAKPGAQEGRLVESADYRHPVLAPFATIPFDSRRPERSPRVKMMFNMKIKPPTRSIITATGGHPLLALSEAGRGRVALLAIGIDRNWGDLPVRGLFVPLMHRLVTFLAGAETAAEPVTAGGDITFYFDDWKPGESLTIIYPGGKRETVVPEVERGRFRVRLAAPNQPGFYSLSGPKGVLDIKALNPDPGESDLATVDRKQLERLPWPIFWLEPGEDPASLADKAARGKDLSRYFFLAALLALALELFLGTMSLVGRESKKGSKNLP